MPADLPTTPWLRSADTRPGPRPAYTLDQIADVCVRLADEAGLQVVAMRRVADALGTGAASLYRYVRGKDDLFALMVDRVAAEYDFPALTGDVRTDVLSIAEQSRLLHRRHPWLSRIGPTALGPRTLRYLDRMAGALGPTGLDATATMTGIAQLTGWVTAFAAHEAAGSAPGQTADADAIAALSAQGDYPHLGALMASQPPEVRAEPVDMDAAFRAGIDALLFGIVRNDQAR